MASIDPLAALNAPQRRAVTFGQPIAEGKGVTCGPLLVVAGAGTGKTETIAHRAAWLAMNGVDPQRIMLLTFTRRAASQMRRRAHDIMRLTLGDTLGNKAQAMLQRLVWAGTFHSIGNRLLRHYGRHLNLEPGYTVIDRSDSADLFDNLRQELKLSEQHQRFPRKDTCLAIYSWRINTQKSLHETLEQQFQWCLSWEQDLAKLCRAYVERKQRCGLLDYDDLLVYWQAMMNEPRLAQQVASNFDHVLVDEYQDTNKLQGEIVRHLRPDGAGVTVVGDDAQSIYSFRGAVVENILGFPDHYTPKAEIITLAQNYRATQPLLDVANALMADAPRQHRKHLLSVRGAGGRPQYVTADELQTQAEYVCAQVLKRREMGVLLRTQAVLFRNASASDVLEVELLQRKIPFVKYGGLKFMEATHVKDMLAVLNASSSRWSRPAALSRCSRRSRSRPPRSTIWPSWPSSWPHWASRNDPGPGRCAWCATGISRTWYGSTSRRTRALAIWTSSSRSPRNFRAANALSPSWRSTRPMPPAIWPVHRSRTRITWCFLPCTRPRAWSGTPCTCSTSSTGASPRSSPPAGPS